MPATVTQARAGCQSPTAIQASSTALPCAASDALAICRLMRAQSANCALAESWHSVSYQMRAGAPQDPATGDAGGRCTVRAFRGRLAVTAEDGERRGTATVDLDADAGVVITLR